MPVLLRRARRALVLAIGASLLAGSGLLAGPADPSSAAAEHQTSMMLFDGGGDDTLNGIRYHSFRIPAIVTTKAGSLIAFAEGRHRDNRDFGNINLLYKRSTDNGATWSSLREVVGAGEGVWGNPTPVVDHDTGRIWLFMNHQPADGYPVDDWGDRRVYSSYSDDDGLTWSTPVDRTTALKPRQKPSGAAFTWDAVGPGIGIQTRFANPGRLVIPAMHRLIYSDDHGQTWRYSFMTDGGRSMEETSESTVTELMDGTLYRNDRATSRLWDTYKRRLVATGSIGGDWTGFRAASCLLDPQNQASVVRYNTDSPDRLIFLNSASTEHRRKMRVRVSEDDGGTWKWSRPLSDAPLAGVNWPAEEGGYSSMTKTRDYHVGALVEVNEDVPNSPTSHRSIAFRKFNLPWMKGGVYEPDCQG